MTGEHHFNLLPGVMTTGRESAGDAADETPLADPG
jgi:hypothetical protein